MDRELTKETLNNCFGMIHSLANELNKDLINTGYLGGDLKVLIENEHGSEEIHEKTNYLTHLVESFITQTRKERGLE